MLPIPNFSANDFKIVEEQLLQISVPRDDIKYAIGQFSKQKGKCFLCNVKINLSVVLILIYIVRFFFQ